MASSYLYSGSVSLAALWRRVCRRKTEVEQGDGIGDQGLWWLGLRALWRRSGMT